MPVKFGIDDQGCYAQWGSSTKYRYNCGNDKAKEEARKKAQKQGAAIKASGYTEK